MGLKMVDLNSKNDITSQDYLLNRLYRLMQRVEPAPLFEHDEVKCQSFGSFTKAKDLS